MANVNVALFHYSVTVHTLRREVLYALRGMSMAVQRTINNKIPWRDVTDSSWMARNHHATFYFSSAEYRDQFLALARELILETSWSYVGDNDEIPAPSREAGDV